MITALHYFVDIYLQSKQSHIIKYIYHFIEYTNK